MDLLYKSTRSSENTVTSSEAILKGLADDGGLFVPIQVPALSTPLGRLSRMGYREVAYEVMRLFLTDFTEEELRGCIDRAYDGKFDAEEIAPIREADGDYYLELFHGPTLAFKDMALSILPHLLLASARKNQVENEIVILTATSGDTGKAALAGFADVDGTRIIVFYPKDGVSPIQERQMVTQRGRNASVIGIHGNFDDAQDGVKRMFHDAGLARRMAERGFQFSSANSINIGRLVPQVAYYVYAYARLMRDGVIEEGEPLNVAVPTGNFGNILAAYFAKQMGVPLGTLICASNENKVLYDFFRTGTYDRNRPFILTSSPSMDILISSNLERLIYHIASNDADRCRVFMDELSRTGTYTITDEMRENLRDFAPGYASEADTMARIKELYEQSGYVVDPHTAVASSVCHKYKEETRDARKTLIVSTASPYKFTRSVMTAIDGKYGVLSDFELADELGRISRVSVPRAIEELRAAPVLHHKVCEKDRMRQAVEEILGL